MYAQDHSQQTALHYLSASKSESIEELLKIITKRYNNIMVHTALSRLYFDGKPLVNWLQLANGLAYNRDTRRGRSFFLFKLAAVFTALQ